MTNLQALENLYEAAKIAKLSFQDHGVCQKAYLQLKVALQNQEMAKEAKKEPTPPAE